MYSVILCGGSGTRLWPLSRKNYPKQFIKFFNDHSLLQETFLRMREIMPTENIFIVTNKENLYNSYNQLKELEPDYPIGQILIEPMSLNTAPAITLAIKHLAEKVKINTSAPIIILPADHYIGNKNEFCRVVKEAMENTNDHVGTIGIKPSRPETGYGYIEKGDWLGKYYIAKRFTEKPDVETAQEFVSSNNYVWNSGYYIFNIKTFVNELRKHASEIYSILYLDYQNFFARFGEMPDISIDYAISEKSDKVIVFEGDFGWSDVGSFDSLSELMTNDNTKHISIESKNVFVHSENNRLVATIGVKDLVVIENTDAILIKQKGRSDDLRGLVKYLKDKKYKELEHNMIVHRPWGRYEILVDNGSHKAKKIVVYPGAKLSVQSHYHRAEHWIVVKGIAKILLEKETKLLRENESTFIPAATKHSLENPGKINLELIEVSTGNYLEEDDIQRFEDIYNRV